MAKLYLNLENNCTLRFILNTYIKNINRNLKVTDGQKRHHGTLTVHPSGNPNSLRYLWVSCYSIFSFGCGLLKITVCICVHSLLVWFTISEYKICVYYKCISTIIKRWVRFPHIWLGLSVIYWGSIFFPPPT